jgi:hypothetical protein
MPTAETTLQGPPLSTVPQSVLASLYAERGDSLLHDKTLCRALLADNCGLFSTENFVLASVVREGLLGGAGVLSLSPQARVEALARRIEQQLGFRRDVAHWAASSWALALRWEAIDTKQQTQPPLPSHRRNVSSHHAPTDAVHGCDEHPGTSLLRSVLLAFRSVLDGSRVYPTVGVTEDDSGFSVPCDAAVGCIRLRGFSTQQRHLVFCEQGMHMIGFDDTSSRGAFLHYLDLQKAPCRMSGLHALSIGTPPFNMDLRGTALRCQDLELLINTVREVIAVRWPSGTRGDSKRPLKSSVVG